MEKNYYEILGVEPTANLKEITKAYSKIYDTYSKDMPKEEKAKVLEASKAYGVLIDAEKRAAYDNELAEIAMVQEIQENVEAAIEAKDVASEEPEELEGIEPQEEENLSEIKDLNVKNLDVNESWFKRNKKRLIAGGLSIAMLVTGFVVGRFSKGDKTLADDPTSTITETQKPEEPTIEVLTAENIDEVTSKIVEENEKKGLTIDPVMVKSALFITNLNSFTNEDIYEIFAKQLDGVENQETRMSIISEEIQNMYNYVSAVRTHNNNGKEYIRMADLAYDAEDKAVLNELDTEYCDLVEDLASKEMTAEDYQSSFKYVTEFYTGAGYLTTDGKEYNNYSMTAGGGLLAEAYWPMFAVAYRSSELETKENEVEIKTLSEGDDAVVNGSKYLGSIVSMINNCEVKSTEVPTETDTKTK